MSPAPSWATTDSDGRFAADSLAPGEIEIAVRAAGHAIWRDTANTTVFSFTIGSR